MKMCAAALGALTLVLVAPSAQAVKCGATPAKKLYAIGSSTMGMTLGAILKKRLKPNGVKTRVWGKASSGLARPDFHDWVGIAPGLMKRHRPDVVVVALGTNDGQNLKSGKHWFSFGSKAWRKIYRQRVDTLLKHLAGPNKHRPVVWLGPTALADRRGAKRMATINALIRSRVEAFKSAGGKVAFVDGIGQTTTKDGKLITRVRSRRFKRNVAARAPDNVHLTRAGVEGLLAEPIFAQLRPCLPKRTAQR